MEIDENTTVIVNDLAYVNALADILNVTARNQLGMRMSII